MRLPRRAVLAGALALPAVARAAQQRVLKFIPQADLTILDPILTTAYVTRNHAYMVFDTLFGQDGHYRPTLQMLESATQATDGLEWRLVLRPGLLFHDGSPVLARDCVASITRWGKRDAFGGALMAATDDLSAPDDRTIRFRLKKPFPLLPDALGKTPTLMPAMMPERLAQTDAFKPVAEMVGSGPFRFLADERVTGARVAYARNLTYVPRDSGVADWTSGPKIVHFDRVEWTVIPDEATAAAAMQTGEADWWEFPSADLLPLLTRNQALRASIPDPTGAMVIARLNHLQPPFNNPGIRRALLGAINQADFMTAAAGTDPAMWRDKVGVFCPDTPMATTAGMEVLTSPRNLDAVRRAVKASGYDGETAVVLSANDVPFRRALAAVAADMLDKVGIRSDLQTVDWGTLVQRRENKGPPAAGGWSMIVTNLSGIDLSTPAGHAFRTNGDKAWFGWPSSTKLEALRQAWLDAPDVAAQQRICTEIQAQSFVDVPQLPMGQFFQPTIARADLHGMQAGFAMFWGIRRG